MAKMQKFGSGNAVRAMPDASEMGSMNMAKGGKVKGKSKGKAAFMEMMRDRMGRGMADKGAEAPMPMMSKGGKTKKMAKGGSVGDGMAQRGRTRCSGAG